MNSEILHDQLYLPCFRHFVELPSFYVFISGLSNLLSGSNNIASWGLQMLQGNGQDDGREDTTLLILDVAQNKVRLRHGRCASQGFNRLKLKTLTLG